MTFDLILLTTFSWVKLRPRKNKLSSLTVKQCTTSAGQCTRCVSGELSTLSFTRRIPGLLIPFTYHYTPYTPLNLSYTQYILTHPYTSLTPHTNLTHRVTIYTPLHKPYTPIPLLNLPYTPLHLPTYPYNPYTPIHLLHLYISLTLSPYLFILLFHHISISPSIYIFKSPHSLSLSLSPYHHLFISSRHHTLSLSI